MYIYINHYLISLKNNLHFHYYFIVYFSDEDNVCMCVVFECTIFIIYIYNNIIANIH